MRVLLGVLALCNGFCLSGAAETIRGIDSADKFTPAASLQLNPLSL